MIKLSACTIAKNEALNIGKSIDSYKDYVDEIIVVDTGSIDETVEIAKSKGAKVFNIEWKNDFSAAKNFALDNATGDWIIFLDADEWFDKDSAKNIRSAIERAIANNYNSVACTLISYFTEDEILESVSTIRIFKHADNIRFCRAIHEALFDINKNEALPGLYSELFTINHSGYMKELAKKKAKRNKMFLDKNFANGNASYIDYFYGIRENLTEDINMSNYFYKLVENTPNYDELVESFNISVAVDENKIKLTNSLKNEYSFEYREELLRKIQEKYPDNPLFKFYEYILYESIDKKHAINALKDAIEYDKTFDKKNVLASNPFFGKRSGAYTILGGYYAFIGDKVKALECFTEAVKLDFNNGVALNGLLYIISNEKVEDMVMFLNSIYDISNKTVENFLVNNLRITRYKELFLYYFVDYYKKYEEVEISYFTSRILTGNFEEVIDKYLEVYREQKDDKALFLITVALIAGNCNEKFLKVAQDIPYQYFKILRAYFNEKIIENITDSDIEKMIDILKEFAYIADESTIEKFVKISGVAKEKIYYELLNYYYSQYSYDNVLKLCNKIKEKIDGKIKVYCEYLKTNILFRNGDFENILEPLENTITGGYLDSNIVTICEILEADDDKLKEYFELFDDVNFIKKYKMLDKLGDISSDTVRFMSVEKFEDEINNKKITLIEENAKDFFDFAKKAEKDKAYTIAEKYYKLAIKYGYMIDKAYFSLGKIYNKFEKFELSYYCYEKAFLENLVLARDLLPNGHPNSKYIFTRKKEVEVVNCPICNSESKLCGIYTNIEDERLSYNEPLIVKYRKCENCGHIFLANDIAEKIYWQNDLKKQNNKENITLYYDVLEDISDIIDGSSILNCVENNEEFEVCAKNYGFNVTNVANDRKFDVVFLGDALNCVNDLDECIETHLNNMAQDGIMVFQLFDEGNAFSRFAEKPLWVKADVKNVFSRNSLEELLNKFDLHILQLNIDKINRGEIIVFVGR